MDPIGQNFRKYLMPRRGKVNLIASKPVRSDVLQSVKESTTANKKEGSSQMSKDEDNYNKTPISHCEFTLVDSLQAAVFIPTLGANLVQSKPLL